MARLGRRPPIWLVLALVVVLNVCLLASRPAGAPGKTSRLQALVDGRRRWPSPLQAVLEPSLSPWSPSLPPPSLLSRRTFPFPDPPGPDDAPDGTKWLLLPGLLVYTLLLLGSLGIVSGDYLVPNLASLAGSLGLSDNTAGVTLLAFGNGSPDVFSTYASFTTDAGSLAVGELLGAAMFIVTVVVGSMALIQPFSVHRGPFLRDVGFALAAVALLLLVMRDGELQTWEAGSMVGLYATYVAGVVGGGYFIRWRERRRTGKIRLGSDDGRGADDEDEEARLFGEEQGTSLAASRSLPTQSAGDCRRLTCLAARTSRSAAEYRDEDDMLVLDAANTDPTSPLPQRPISLSAVSFSGPSDLLQPPTPDGGGGSRPALRPSLSQTSIRSAGSAGSTSRAAGQPVRPPAGVRTPSRPGGGAGRPSNRSRRSSNASQMSFDVRRSTFSLLGAVEFRDLVNALKADEAELLDGADGAEVASPFEALKEGLGAGGSPFSGAHYHAHAPHPHGHGRHHAGGSHARTRSLGGGAGGIGAGGSVSAGQALRSPALSRRAIEPPPLTSPTLAGALVSAGTTLSAPGAAGRLSLASEVNPWEQATAPGAGVVPASSGHSSAGTVRPGGRPLASPSSLIGPAGRARSASSAAHYGPSASPLAPPAPAIVLHSTSSTPPAVLLPSAPATPYDLEQPSQPRVSKRRRALHLARLTYHTLCPSLQQLGRKSLVGKLLSILAVPAIFALTVTVCVVDDRGDDDRTETDSTLSSVVDDDDDGRSTKEALLASTTHNHEHNHAGQAAEVTHGRLLDLGEDPSTPHGHDPHHRSSHEAYHHGRGEAHPHPHPQPTAAFTFPDGYSLSVDGGDATPAFAQEDDEADAGGETEAEMCCEESCADVALGFDKWLLAAQCIRQSFPLALAGSYTAWTDACCSS